MWTRQARLRAEALEGGVRMEEPAGEAPQNDGKHPYLCPLLKLETIEHKV